MRAKKHSKRRIQEKYGIFILGIAFLLIVLLTIGFFTYRSYPSDKRMDDQYLSDAAQPEIYIPQTRSLLFNSQSDAVNRVYAGKIYYQGKNGKLESHINQNKNEVCEELISYDDKGKEVDKLEISYVCDSTKRSKYAVIFKNKISIYETKSSGDDKNGGILTEYLISPQMKFSREKTYTNL